MHIDELKAKVQGSLTKNFDIAFAEFCEARGSSDLMEFLLDLVERDVLQPEALQAISEALPELEDGTLALEPRDDGSNGEEEAPQDGTLADQEPAQPAPAAASGARSTGERPRQRTRDSGTQPGAPRRSRRRPDDSGKPRATRKPSRLRGESSASGKTGRGYEFIGFVGEGAMGKVRLATDLDLQRTVAYKEMSEEILRNKTLAAKFYAEAQITAQLDHPNIVPIYALDETDAGALAYSMKLIKGKTMETLVEECWEFYDKKKKRDEEHALETRLDQFLRCCEAMHYAHSRGVIHRDLKPENIMIGPYGEVYIMDWGIARVMPPPTEKTPTAWVVLDAKQKPEGEMIIGTPQYMSPEQADGVTEELTAASDQYSLGLILYELVSLRQAVSGKTPMAIITRQTEGDKDPLRHYAKDKIATELRAIIAKATSLKIEDRYENVKELAEDIKRYLRNEAVKAKPDTPLQKILRWMQKHKEITLLGIVAGFLFFSIVTLGSQIYYQAQRIAAAAREEALSEVLTKVATQAAMIDGNFVRYEGMLGVLGASSVEMLGRLDPGDPDLFLSADYDSDAVPELESSRYYGMPVSLDFPVNVLAKSADPQASTNDLKRLEPLSRYYRTVILRSHSEEAATYTRKRADRLIKDVGAPIAWAHVGLKGGAYSGFPGHGGYAAIFDPRATPWYKLAEKRKIPTWGAPYIDPTGLGLILPCAKSLYNDDDEFLGVSAIELTFDYIIEKLLEIEELKDDSEAFLLDKDAKVVIRSSKKGKEYKGSSLRARTIRMPEFDDEEVVAQIKDRDSGYVENYREGTLTVYYRMNSIGWYYVVMGKSADLL
jgi:serine/threonine-protein kinase